MRTKEEYQEAMNRVYWLIGKLSYWCVIDLYELQEKYGYEDTLNILQELIDNYKENK